MSHAHLTLLVLALIFLIIIAVLQNKGRNIRMNMAYSFTGHIHSYYRNRRYALLCCLFHSVIVLFESNTWYLHD